MTSIKEAVNDKGVVVSQIENSVQLSGSWDRVGKAGQELKQVCVTNLISNPQSWFILMYRYTIFPSYIECLRLI